MSGAADFSSYIASLGFTPPPRIEPGRFVRFATSDKRADQAGYAKLFPDQEGGIVGDFRSGEVWTWQAQRTKDYSEAERRTWRERIERERKEAEALQERERKQTAERAKAIWDGAKPAPEDHPYLVAKGVQSHGLRLYRGPLALNGMRCDGALLIPERTAAGDLASLQFISPSGEKRHLNGSKHQACYFPIGKPEGVLLIAEGYATAASLHAATGHAVAVAFDAGSLEAVARAMREKFQAVKLIICADNDIHAADGKANTGVVAATKAAQAVGGLLAVPELEGAKCDFNDVAKARGAAVVKQAIDAAGSATASIGPTEKKPTGLVCKRLSEIESKPIRWLWPGRIARGKVSMLAGHPGLGKSQITASLAAIVTTAGRWPVDRTTCERGSVLFLSAEDDPADTIRPRLEAAGGDLDRIHILQSVRDGFNAAGEEVQRAFNLREDIRRLEEALQEIGDVALVVIDPVSAYLGGADSHNNAEVRALLAPLSDMAARCGVAIVAVSHLNKGGGGSDALSRVTGSLAFVAAARAAYIVAKDPEDEARRLFLPAKNNIGADIGGLAFQIEPVGLAGGIETSRIAWAAEAVRDTNADEVMRPADVREDRSAVEDAAEFLRSLLADAPMPAKHVYREASDAGHSQASIRRAQRTAGVESFKDGMGGGWQWRLAPKMLKSPEDAQPKTLSAFGKNERLRESEAGPADDQGERF